MCVCVCVSVCLCVLIESVYTQFIPKFSVESPHIPRPIFQIRCHTSCILYRCVFLFVLPTDEPLSLQNAHFTVLQPNYLLMITTTILLFPLLIWYNFGLCPYGVGCLSCTFLIQFIFPSVLHFWRHLAIIPRLPHVFLSFSRILLPRENYHSRSRFLFTIPSLICLIPKLCHYIHVHINLTPPPPFDTKIRKITILFFLPFISKEFTLSSTACCLFSISSSLVRFSFTRNRPVHFFTHFLPCLQSGHIQAAPDAWMITILKTVRTAFKFILEELGRIN